MTDDPTERVRAAMRGHHGAMEELWNLHRRWVAALLLAHRAAGDVEDLLQNVALAFVSRLGSLKEPAAFRAWLRRVALNVAQEGHRRTLANEGRETSRGDLADAPARPSGSEERLRPMLDVIKELPPVCREALLLKAVNGLSQRDIAAILDVPETTVESRLSRGRRLLRDGMMRRVGDC